ncbi:MAG: hypothetical protein FWG58_01610 [Methanomassiliicoccaceae archaeon]|nr:hypothetical protein [Methanomassiliicoccaceae archaeon]
MTDLTIDCIRHNEMSKIYCKCGNIASIDKNILKMKRQLRKEAECAVCRNHRISDDLDHLNGLFDGTLDADADSYF